MILETIITTINADNTVHIAPMGIREEEGCYVVAPFRPSITLDNLRRTGYAVINMTDDVRIFAGCLTGRRNWPTVPAEVIECQRLENALSHVEVEVKYCKEDEQRPKFYCEVRHLVTHKPFMGFNRAKAAVIEAAVLVSRLHMLSVEKVDSEIEYLKIAIDKTSGDQEREAWDWLMERIREFREQDTAGVDVA
ncbi:MAG: DUF447 family protein [Gammaproteobacteria bacterium]|nr:DUF447 family protein [Gammaproteobacteria bacterium]